VLKQPFSLFYLVIHKAVVCRILYVCFHYRAVLPQVLHNHGLSERLPSIEQMREEAAAWNR
jgi:hypothetical protein